MCGRRAAIIIVLLALSWLSVPEPVCVRQIANHLRAKKYHRRTWYWRHMIMVMMTNIFFCSSAQSRLQLHCVVALPYVDSVICTKIIIHCVLFLVDRLVKSSRLMSLHSRTSSRTDSLTCLNHCLCYLKLKVCCVLELICEYQRQTSTTEVGVVVVGR